MRRLALRATRNDHAFAIAAQGGLTPGTGRMADIFVSYTISDQEWAFWIGHELEALGHAPRIHEWEIPGGGDIMAWMEGRHHEANCVLCVVSNAYLKKPYSSLERRAAQWASLTDRPNFLLPVFIEPCEAPTLFAPLKRCDLYGLAEGDARARLKAFLSPPAKPPRGAFPSSSKSPSPPPSSKPPPLFPGKAPLSNIPISVPRYFLGRNEALAEIATTLARPDGRAAITTLHGMRGVGKTALAAAYAEQHRGDYRATWWVRARIEPSIRADLVALGVRLGWLEREVKEDDGVAAALDRLRHDGEGILLIYDDAVDALAVGPFLPKGGRARVLITSNAHDWRRVADPVEIKLWPKSIGADYLIARTGRAGERFAAEALSEALGGLPLAHEQAAAYCERLDISFAEYRKRFDATPVRLLDDARDAPPEHNDGMTVAKSFALAIEEAAKLNLAAEPLIIHAALLAPEPIPLFLFSDGISGNFRGISRYAYQVARIWQKWPSRRDRGSRLHKFGEPLASALAGDGLDEAVAALRTFALVDREAIVDERDASITTDAVRLHRLVREVAAARTKGETRDRLRLALIAALAAVYPWDGYSNPGSWPRCALLTPHLLAICETEIADTAANAERARLLDRAGAYFLGRAAYSAARPLLERVLAIREKALGPEHPDTAKALNNLARLLQDQGDLAAARPLYERALAIYVKALGPKHPDTATSLGNLGRLLQDQGDLAAARPLLERTLAIREKALGPEHPATATALQSLALLLAEQGDVAAAQPLYERALAIYVKARGPEHLDTATGLSGLALLLQDQGDLAAARPLLERVLAIREKALGPEHPDTATGLHNLAILLAAQGDVAAARPLLERALAIQEKMHGPEHPDTATGLHNLARLLADQGDLAAARPLFERALAMYEKMHGPDHTYTAIARKNLAKLTIADSVTTPH
jgi:tetratricopeptide (TPR) repeat protein